MNIEQKIKDDIARAGHSVVAVMSDGEEPGFAYTVGLYETYRHPEIIVMGLPPKVAHTILQTVVREIVAGGEWVEIVRPYDALANLPLAFIRVNEKNKEEYMLMLDNHYGVKSKEVDVLQMVWPDENGVLPYEAEYDAWFELAQPLLGSVAVTGKDAKQKN